MAFGRIGTAIGVDDSWKVKFHELEMRLNGIEYVYLKELEKKIAEVAMNAGAFRAEEKTFTKQQIEDAAATSVPFSYGKKKAAAKKK